MLTAKPQLQHENSNFNNWALDHWNWLLYWNKYFMLFS